MVSEETSHSAHEQQAEFTGFQNRKKQPIGNLIVYMRIGLSNVKKIHVYAKVCAVLQLSVPPM